MNVIYKTIPRHTEVNVGVDQVMEVYFMVDLNKTSVKPETVMLFNLKEQRVEPVRLEYRNRVLKVTALSNMMPDGHYQLQLLGGDNGLSDITGRVMPETVEVEFTTKDVAAIKPPVILAPTDVSVVQDSATFKLREAAGADHYEIQISRSNTFQNLLWPVNGEKVYQTSVTPSISYTTGLYYMRVRSFTAEGEDSSWSEPIRFFYDGAPIIQEPVEEEVPVSEEPVAEPVSIQSSRQVLLKTASRAKGREQLNALQQLFSAKAEQEAAALKVADSSLKDKSVNNNISKFNNLLASGNQRKLTVTFTEELDAASVTGLTAYVLAERN